MDDFNQHDSTPEADFDRRANEAAAFVGLDEDDWPPAMRALSDILGAAVDRARERGASHGEVRAAVAELAAVVGGDDIRPMREAIATAQLKWYSRAHPDADHAE